MLSIYPKNALDKGQNGEIILKTDLFEYKNRA
jgi:hypothetical protein